jgi:hypothetical protein
MRYKLIENAPKTYVVIFDTGDELTEGLTRFANDLKLSSASFKAIGALSAVQLGWFNWTSKQYKPSVQLDEQLELLSFIGDIALNDGKPQVHAHAIVGREDGTAHGGHLMMARVRPTCEVVLVESAGHLQKQLDPESGLALIRT